MANETLAQGVAHKIPDDLRKALVADDLVVEKWNDLTPLARNEWICWNISPKQQKTKDEHIKRTVQELKEGKRRPCCWVGCIHRKDKPMSASQKWVTARK